MVSIRDQWITLIGNKIDERIKAIKESNTFMQLATFYIEKFQQDIKKPGIERSLEVLHRQTTEAYQKYNDLSTQESKLREEYMKAFRDLDLFGKNCWKGLDEMKEEYIDQCAINDIAFKTTPTGIEYENLIKTRKNLPLAFLVANTPKQMQEVANKLLKSLGVDISTL